MTLKSAALLPGKNEETCTWTHLDNQLMIDTREGKNPAIFRGQPRQQCSREISSAKNNLFQILYKSYLAKKMVKKKHKFFFDDRLKMC